MELLSGSFRTDSRKCEFTQHTTRLWDSQPLGGVTAISRDAFQGGTGKLHGGEIDQRLINRENHLVQRSQKCL